MLSKFLDPKNDFAFKRIFGTDKHKDILIHFLNDVLGQSDNIKIVDVEFLSPIQDPDALAKKQSIVDVLCKDQNGRKYIIEMQVARTAGFESRAQYYAAKAYASQMGRGGKYENLKEVIFIAILDCELFPNKEHYKSNHTIRDDLSNERNLDGLRFVFVELPRFNTKLEELATIMEKWCYFFKHAPETTAEELTQLIKNEPIIKKAYDALDSYAWSDQDLMRYEQETKSEMDALSILRQSEFEGRLKGKAEGKVEEKIEIARKMKSAGMSAELIRQVTGIDIDKL